MSVVFKYLYRDAGNNKLWGDIILTNRSDIDVQSAETTIRSSLIDEEFFIAEQIEVPVLSFDSHEPDLDHGWHEFHSITDAVEIGDDQPVRDLSDFLKDFKRASVVWKRTS
ncbi:MAG: hypothetical protein IH600_08835 [Bacteroidetes bacterium]|nr:hypothetical protein [Bacteroidota bacterium]